MQRWMSRHFPALWVGSRVPRWLLCAVVLVAPCRSVRAQTYRVGDDGRSIGRAIGMEVFWRTQTLADGGRSFPQHVVPYVSSTEFRTAFEVVVGDTRRAFVPEMTDRWGAVLGSEGAERQAKIEQRVLNSQGIDAKVDQRQFRATSLYLQTNEGVLQSIDAETGQIRWTTVVGSPNAPASAPGVSDTAVASVVGSSLSVLSPQDGKFRFSRPLHGIPAGSVAIGGDWVFVPQLRGRVELQPLASDRGFPRFLQSNGFMSSDMVASPNRLSWATDLGYLYVADAKTATVKFRIETRGTIIHHASFAADETLCFGTSDGMVIAANPQNGSIQWQYMAGSSIAQSPMVHQDFVCAVTIDGDLICLDLATGAVRWRRAGIQAWAGVMADKLIALDQQGNLIAIDQEHGNLIGRSQLNGLSLLVSQVLTDRLFLTNGKGQVLALRPRGAIWPEIYAPLAPQESAEESTEKGPATETAGSVSPKKEAEASPASPEKVPAGAEGAEEDPFGGENPFDDGGADNPFDGE